MNVERRNTRRAPESDAPHDSTGTSLLSAADLDLGMLPEREGVYLVGGTVRDLLLGKTPVDYDLAVSGNPERFAAQAAARCGSRVVPMGRPGKMSFRVQAGDTVLDITGLDGATIREDLARRDVTINAMALELSSGRLLDVAGGRRDLSAKQIRMVSDGSFREDPVRLLRAFRLAASLGFSIEADTLSAIRRDAGELGRSAGERIRSELHQLLRCRNTAPLIDQMAAGGLLGEIFRMPARLPDAYRRLEAYLDAPPPALAPYLTGPAPSITPTLAPWLKFATLLIRQFRGAPEPGAVCRRLRLSNRESSFVAGMARHHTRPFRLFETAPSGRPAPGEVTRLFMEAGALCPYLLVTALADAPEGHAFAPFAHRLLREYHETYLPRKAHPPLVTGQDLSNRFSLPPSPLFKEILTRIEAARLSGEVSHREAALALTEKILRDRGM